MNRVLAALAILGLSLFVAGLFLAPDRIWPGYLVAALYFTGLCLAGPLLVALFAVTGARWATAIRRVPEAMASVLPLAFVLMLPMAFGASTLYEWTRADAVAGDEALLAKAGWLSLPFFLARTVLWFALWIWLSRRLLTRPGQDRAGPAALFLVAFAVTFTLATIDWGMSLEPHWASTMYGVYHFSGLLLSGVAATIVLVVFLERTGPLRQVLRPEHLHDLGKLLFAMSTFWAYIWFCQYMLIWYSNLPEETAYFVGRTGPAWGLLFVINVALNWGIPFLVLLPRPAKRSAYVLTRAAACVLLGRWLDLYLLVAPANPMATPAFGLWEVGPLVGAISLFVLVWRWAYLRGPAVPAGDPTLAESMTYHA